MAEPKTPPASDESPVTPTGSNDSPVTPDGEAEQSPAVDRTKAIIETRLARERAKTAKLIEQAREQAVAEFRTRYGVTDDTLAQLGQSHFADLYKRISTLEGEIEGYRSRERAAGEEKRQALLAAELESRGVLPEVRELVARDLAQHLALGDDGKLRLVDGDDKKTVATFIREYLRNKPTLVRATGISGAGTARPADGAHGERAGARDSVLGIFQEPTAEQAREMWRAFRGR